MALLFAVERFDPTKGFKFESFAAPTIIGEIKRYFRDKGWALKVPRQLKDIATQLAGAQDQLYIELHRQPTPKEIGEYLGYSEEQILEAMESRYSFQALSLNQALENDDPEENSVQVEQFIGVNEQGFDDFENASLINKVVSSLDEREKTIFAERIMKGGVQKELAEQLGISQMTLSRIENKIHEKFKEEFKK
jgi:RNA polymerase sigma-B factor